MRVQGGSEGFLRSRTVSISESGATAYLSQDRVVVKGRNYLPYRVLHGQHRFVSLLFSGEVRLELRQTRPCDDLDRSRRNNHLDNCMRPLCV